MAVTRYARHQETRHICADDPTARLANGEKLSAPWNCPDDRGRGTYTERAPARRGYQKWASRKASAASPTRMHRICTKRRKYLAAAPGHHGLRAGARVSCGQGSEGAAAPPSGVMNWRRFTRSPRRRTPTQRVHHAADFQFVSSHDAEIRIHRHSGRRML